MAYKQSELEQLLKETAPNYETSSRLRAVGNSNGIILSNKVLEQAGLNSDTDLTVQVRHGIIIIMPSLKPKVNTDLDTWDEQFKRAKTKATKDDLSDWENVQNNFDKEEWT